MTTPRTLARSLLASLPLVALATAPAAHAQPADAQRPGWTLTFHDNFDGDRLDTTRWLDRYWHGRTHANNEKQYYAPDGYAVRDGTLRLIAQKRALGGMPYTSGMICSFERFAQQYGRFEIRAKFPRGQGFWPAFWLLPANKAWPPEIDVLEILGHEPQKVYMTNHWKEPGGKHRSSKGGEYAGPDFSADFHTFAIEWTADEIVWFVDDVERFRAREGIPREPMYVIANLAVGGDWPKDPDDTTPFPGVMEIDWIRVYTPSSGSN